MNKGSRHGALFHLYSVADSNLRGEQISRNRPIRRRIEGVRIAPREVRINSAQLAYEYRAACMAFGFLTVKATPVTCFSI